MYIDVSVGAPVRIDLTRLSSQYLNALAGLIQSTLIGPASQRLRAKTKMNLRKRSTVLMLIVSL